MEIVIKNKEKTVEENTRHKIEELDTRIKINTNNIMKTKKLDVTENLKSEVKNVGKQVKEQKWSERQETRTLKH